MGITSAPPSTTVTNSVSNKPTQSPLVGCPAPHPPQPPAQSSTVAYPPLGGVPWKCIDAMMQEDKSCPGCHYNHPEYTPQLKFHQEVVCPALSKHGYLFRKYVKASAKVVDNFNTKFPKITDKSRTSKPLAKRLSDDLASEHVAARWVHYPSISNPPTRLQRTTSSN